MYCEEGQCEFNGLMEALKAKDAENARLRAAMSSVWKIVHIPTPGSMKARDHFQRDFDQIRAIAAPFINQQRAERK